MPHPDFNAYPVEKLDAMSNAASEAFRPLLAKFSISEIIVMLRSEVIMDDPDSNGQFTPAWEQAIADEYASF